MIYCPGCGLANRDNSRFCNECGQRLGEWVECASCHFPNLSSANFCNQCGGALRGVAAPVLQTSVLTPEAHDEQPLEAEAPSLPALLDDNDSAFPSGPVLPTSPARDLVSTPSEYAAAASDSVVVTHPRHETSSTGDLVEISPVGELAVTLAGQQASLADDAVVDAGQPSAEAEWIAPTLDEPDDSTLASAVAELASAEVEEGEDAETALDLAALGSSLGDFEDFVLPAHFTDADAAALASLLPQTEVPSTAELLAELSAAKALLGVDENRAEQALSEVDEQRDSSALTSQRLPSELESYAPAPDVLSDSTMPPIEIEPSELHDTEAPQAPERTVEMPVEFQSTTAGVAPAEASKLLEDAAAIAAVRTAGASNGDTPRQAPGIAISRSGQAALVGDVVRTATAGADDFSAAGAIFAQVIGGPAVPSIRHSAPPKKNGKGKSMVVVLLVLFILGLLGTLALISGFAPLTLPSFDALGWP